MFLVACGSDGSASVGRPDFSDARADAVLADVYVQYTGTGGTSQEAATGPLSSSGTTGAGGTIRDASIDHVTDALLALDAGARDSWAPDSATDTAQDAAPLNCVSVATATVAADPCTAYAETRCARSASCSAFEFRQRYGDEATCEALVLRDCRARVDLPGQLPAVLQALHDCATRLAAAPCACVLDEICPEVRGAPGTLPDGSGCGSADQCAGGVCDGASTSICGRCATGAAEGMPCGGAEPACTPGFVCGIGHTCVRPLTRGASCVVTAECADGLVCASGVCSGRLGAAKSCNDGSELCNEPAGVFCVAGVCQEMTIASAVATGVDGGEACGFGVGGFYASCDAFSRCESGRCVQKDSVGAACAPATSESDPTCLPLLACDPTTGECANPQPLVCPTDAGL